MDYLIISTGSKGNCSIIGDVMIDCGVSYKSIEEYLPQVSTIILTHNHKDHYNKSTIKKIRLEYPSIIIIGYGCDGLTDFDVNFEEDSTMTSIYESKNKRFYTFYLNDHSADTHSISVEFSLHLKKILFATDLRNTNSIPNYKIYDYIFIEANYRDFYMKEVALKYRHKMFNHLSVGGAFKFVRSYSNPSSVVEPLHFSSFSI